MTHKRNFFISMITDERGERSSKRMIAIFGTIFLCSLTMVECVFKGAVAPSEELVSAIEMIIITCISATTIDKFSKRHTGAQKTEETQEPPIE